MHKPEGKTRNSLIMELEYLRQVAKHDVPLPSQPQGNAQIIGIHLVIVALKGGSAWGSVYVCVWVCRGGGGGGGSKTERQTDRQMCGE